MNNITERLRAATAQIEQADPRLAEELEAVRSRAAETLRESVGLESFDSSGVDAVGALETIVLRTGRPVLAISNNEPSLVFREAESEIWRDRLMRARDGINHAIRAVGRIELDNNPRFEWVGTGWLVTEDIIVTNRHVASEFARGDGQRFTFRSSSLGKMSASIDFLQEIDNNSTALFDIQDVLHIEPETGPDISFLRVKARDGKKLATPIALSRSALAAKEQVAVIGYPARDSRVPEVDLMDRIFGNVYNKKRLAPGQLIGLGGREIQHDCSTLGGNSGSVVLSLKSGEAVGLHFSGQFLKANFAVPASLVADRLNQISRRGTGAISTTVPASRTVVQPRREQALQATQQTTQQTAEVTFQVPLTISVRLGAVDGSAAVTPQPSTTVVTPVPAGEEDEPAELFTEGRIEDYSDKEGYLVDFLGSDNEVPLPKIKALDDILALSEEEDFILRYQHFSVVMSASRRMCFFSAVNINGKKSRRTKRGPWKIDPRIPREAQIMKECYGNPPKFSRGHMTRREDPAWGNEDEASEGNLDSMHVTNTVPQMQPFNGGIWLGLEDYALQNSREDKMSISVFTGPFFSKQDPIMYGVKIPVTFWKVIAFIHDETNELTATGYTMSQRSFLQPEEFVFGQHETSQTSIRQIEERARLDFGPLRSVDPFRRATESFEAPLTDFSQIRFV